MPKRSETENTRDELKAFLGKDQLVESMIE
jgi:hypothetical protein